MSLAAGLLAHWTLSEPTGNRLDSVGTNHLVPTGGIGTTAAKLGNGTTFDGTATIGAADHPSLSMVPGRSFTVAGWFLRNSVDDGMLIAKGDAAFEVPEYFLMFTGNYALWEVWNAENVFDLFSTPAAPYGTPHLLIAGYRHATEEIHLQVNDEAEEVFIISGGIRDGASEFHIGSIAGAASFLNGWANSVSVWDRDLTSADRAALWNGGAGLPAEQFGSPFQPAWGRGANRLIGGGAT